MIKSCFCCTKDVIVELISAQILDLFANICICELVSVQRLDVCTKGVTPELNSAQILVYCTKSVTPELISAQILDVVNVSEGWVPDEKMTSPFLIRSPDLI